MAGATSTTRLEAVGRDAFPFRSADELFDADEQAGPFAEVARLHHWQAPAFALAAATAADQAAASGCPHGATATSRRRRSPRCAYFDNSVTRTASSAWPRVAWCSPGKAGTLQEIFQDAAQNYCATGKERFNPMVFLDVDGYWTSGLRSGPCSSGCSTTLRANLHWVTTAHDAVAALLAGRS